MFPSSLTIPMPENPYNTEEDPENYRECVCGGGTRLLRRLRCKATTREGGRQGPGAMPTGPGPTWVRSRDTDMGAIGLSGESRITDLGPLSMTLLIVNPDQTMVTDQPKQHSMWAPVGPQLGKVGPQMGPGWA